MQYKEDEFDGLGGVLVCGAWACIESEGIASNEVCGLIMAVWERHDRSEWAKQLAPRGHAVNRTPT